MQKSNINIILNELDAFIRKYYINECCKGLILFLLIAFFYFIAICCAEYVAFFPSNIRTIIFYISLVLAIIAFTKFICLPLFHLAKLGNTLSYSDAAKIVSNFFPEIQDTLLNTLELADDTSLKDNQLAIAAINQKIEHLRPIPFTAAIDLKKLLMFGKYALALIAIIILIVIFYPHAISEGATRIVHHNEQFEKPAPFQFILKNDSLSVLKGDDFSVKMHIEGDYIPENVTITFGGNSFTMTKKSASTFEYLLHGCNKSLDFYCSAEEYSSKIYSLVVIPLPQVLQFSIDVTVPNYTQLENFSVTNTGDIRFPAGSKLTWNIDAIDADSLVFVTENRKQMFQKNENTFSLTHRILHSTSYTLVGKNQHLDSVHVIDYQYSVIPDMSPTIKVENLQDSINFLTYYFKGDIQDDYGFSSLDFVYILNNDVKTLTRIPIEFSPKTIRQQFFFMYDFSQFAEGTSVQYYFEVFDNDEVNGKKSARTIQFDIAVPTQEELQHMREEYTEQIESSFEQSSSLAQELVKDFNKLKQKLLSESISEWERQQVLEEMQQKQEQIKQQVEHLQQSIQQKNEVEQKLSKQDEEILKKQQEIEELLNNLMDEELKKMMDEFNQMMENYQKDNFIKKSDEMQMSFDDLSKQLDKDLELLKRMDVEEHVNSIAERLQELANEQFDLSEQLKNGKNDESIQQELNQVQRELKEAKESYENAKEKNEELQQSFDLQNFEEQFNQIEKSQQQSNSEQQQGQKAKSSKSMKQAAEQTQQLSSQMQSMMQQQLAQQNIEDMANLRQIMENLLTFSFQQEELLSQTSKLSYADPKYAEVTDKQNLLKENFSIIKDSLYALSSRVAQISQPINNEIFTIYKNNKTVIDKLEQRQRSLAKMDQQYIMTSTNNLALLLSEVLESMQQQAAQQMEGQQQCQNPKNSGKGQKPSFQQMKQMQQSLKEQMQQMMQQMKEGGMPSQQTQKQLSEMLMKEQMLKQLGNKMMQNGELSPEGVQQLKDIQHLMDQTERDIVNQNITPQTLMRQEQILTRMLEVEHSESQRDTDKERESKTAKEINSEKAEEMFQKTKPQQTQYEDVLQEKNIQLKPSYQKMYSDYIIDLNEN